MVAVKGVLKITPLPDGGLRVVVDCRCGLYGEEPSHPGHVLELTGQEWRQVQDLVRQDAKVANLLAEAREQQSDIEGIAWTP